MLGSHRMRRGRGRPPSLPSVQEVTTTTEVEMEPANFRRRGSYCFQDPRHHSLRDGGRKRSSIQLQSSAPVNCPPVKTSNPLLSLITAFFTFLAFVITLISLPWLILLYFVVRACRKGWVILLESKFPGLEFVRKTTPRTAVDTIRNQGIITVLLRVKGPCQINLIKTRIQEVILKKCAESGEDMYPHLRSVLTSRWGRYAWIRGSHKKFHLDNHILMGNSLFKGRPVTETNIQEYVSDVVSKLLPPELPPWQVTIASSQTGEYSYLLIRLHHLYLSEDRVSLGELLMLRQDESWEQEERLEREEAQHILSGTFNHPVLLPRLYSHLVEAGKTAWNETLYTYDTEEALARVPDLRAVAARCLVAVVNAARLVYNREYWDPFSALRAELDKRRLSVGVVVEAVGRALSPLALIRAYFTFWLSLTSFFLSLPGRLLRDVPVYLYRLYLAHYTLQELFYLLGIVYTAPRVLFEEIFLPEYPRNVHRLQTLSLCGRKVVSWSRPVPIELLEGVTRSCGATPCEVLLSATSASLRDYLDRAGYSVPESVVTTSRFMPQHRLFLASQPPASSGMLCLPLPTATPPSNPLASLRALQDSLRSARSKQAALYLASVYRLDYNLFTSVFPSVFARACLYLLSRRYAVSLTQIDSLSAASDTKPRRLIWGQEVERIMYWRPPQANVCLSLTLMSYGGSVQLGVMGDAQLAPHHVHITNSFSDNIYQLAAATRANLPRNVHQ